MQRYVNKYREAGTNRQHESMCVKHLRVVVSVLVPPVVSYGISTQVKNCKTNHSWPVIALFSSFCKATRMWCSARQGGEGRLPCWEVVGGRSTSNSSQTAAAACSLHHFKPVVLQSFELCFCRHIFNALTSTPHFLWLLHERDRKTARPKDLKTKRKKEIIAQFIALYKVRSHRLRLHCVPHLVMNSGLTVIYSENNHKLWLSYTVKVTE